MTLRPWNDSFAGSKLLVFNALVAGRNCPVLIDSGSQGDFVSTRHLQQCSGLQQSRLPSPLVVKQAGGTPVAATHQAVQVPLSIQSYSDTIAEMPAIDLQAYGAVLGKPWLTRLNPDVDWRYNTLTLEHEGQRHHLCPANEPTAPPLPPGISIISHKQARKACKRGEPCYLVALQAEAPRAAAKPSSAQATDSPVDDALNEDPERFSRWPGLKELLLRYKDVFCHEWPPILAPRRRWDHEIPLIPGAKAVARPVYRMSPDELTVLRAKLDELLRVGFISPTTTSEFGAPVRWPAGRPRRRPPPRRW